MMVSGREDECTMKKSFHVILNEVWFAERIGKGVKREVKRSKASYVYHNHRKRRGLVGSVLAY